MTPPVPSHIERKRAKSSLRCQRKIRLSMPHSPTHSPLLSEGARTVDVRAKLRIFVEDKG